jgi:hypothetical protein
MVDLALLQSVSYIAGALGVLVAAIYYIVTLRNSETARAREVVYNRSQMHRLEFYNALNVVFTMTGFSTYDEFNKKYGRSTNPSAYANFLFVGWVYNNAGVLLREKLADSKQILLVYNPTTIVAFWDRFGVVARGVREHSNYPDYWKPLESLYEEVKRVYPDLIIESMSEADVAVQ